MGSEVWWTSFVTEYKSLAPSGRGDRTVTIWHHFILSNTTLNGQDGIRIESFSVLPRLSVKKVPNQANQ